MKPIDLEKTLPEPLPVDPLPLVESWLAAARALPTRNPTAMALATCDAQGAPSVRFVLCRGFDVRAGYFVFFTDRTSAKGHDLEASPRAALVFYWEPFERQVRVRGPVLPSPDEESDAYFNSRAGGAQISATVSQQSQPLRSRSELVEAQERLARGLGVSLEDAQPGGVPRPKRWGGYRVWAEELELWIGQPNRLHDRARFTRELAREGDGFRTGPWRGQRLQP